MKKNEVEKWLSGMIARFEDQNKNRRFSNEIYFTEHEKKIFMIGCRRAAEILGIKLESEPWKSQRGTGNYVHFQYAGYEFHDVENFVSGIS